MELLGPLPLMHKLLWQCYSILKWVGIENYKVIGTERNRSYTMAIRPLANGLAKWKEVQELGEGFFKLLRLSSTTLVKVRS